MGRVLVVANQTLGCPELTGRIDALREAGPCELVLLVPVTRVEGEHQWDYPPVDRMVPDAALVARSLAEGRLAAELARLAHQGVTAVGEVVDDDPVDRACALLDGSPADSVVVCTLPHHLSRWLRVDMPHRLARAVDVPVEQLPGSPGPSL